MKAPITPAGLHDGTIAAYRYLAFLDLEYHGLIHEMFPDRTPGDHLFIPVDSQVHALCRGASPLDRCETVLRAVGVDPFKYDHWVPTIGVDFNKLPVIRPDDNRPKTRK